jgi:hypothetical protein
MMIELIMTFHRRLLANLCGLESNINWKTAPYAKSAITIKLYKDAKYTIIEHGVRAMKDLLEKIRMLEQDTKDNDGSAEYGFYDNDYEGKFEYELYGDDGETAYGTIHYKASNGVVDPKSLQGDFEYEGNARVDSDLATQMIQPGGDEHEEALKAAQEDHDYERDRLMSKFEDVNDEQTFEGEEFYKYYGFLPWHEDVPVEEAEYQGRKVKLGKPTRGDVKKFKVYVRDPKTKNIKKVNFGDPNMKIKRSNPKRRKSFRARHNCANPGPRTKARYWSCRNW